MTPRQGLGIAFGIVAMILWIMAGGYLCNDGDGERATGIYHSRSNICYLLCGKFGFLTFGHVHDTLYK
jgi:hypothetical protein